MSLLQELIHNLGISGHDLQRIIATAPARYKVYEIPKRSGGMRTIAQPSRELKEIQRYILQTKLPSFPIHPVATAYVTGRGIRHNAAEHAQGKYLLKLDFTNFFPSIKTVDWTNLCRKSNSDVIELKDLPMYSKILFWGAKKKSILPRCLSIGAPTSPVISNIIMFELDTKLSEAASRFGVIYTRYADDIAATSSNDDAIHQFEAEARRIVRSSKYPKLTFNDKKRGLYRRGERRMVTGLIITHDRKISIGRARKREIAALLHKFSLDDLDPEKRAFLKGMLGFSIACEPEFIGRMRKKYGDKVVDAALTYFVPSRATRTTFS